MTAVDNEAYRSIVEDAPVLLWRGDAGARCAYVNRAWLELTGRSVEEELGDGWRSALHPADEGGFVALYVERFARRAPFETELRLRRADGTYACVVARGAPLSAGEGTPEAFVVSAMPRPLRHEDHTVENAEFFEMSLDHLCVAGFDGYWKRLNGSWTRTLGWTPEEMMARPLIDFCHPDDREATLAARGRLKDGVPLRTLSNRYLCRDGTYRWFEWRSVAHVDRGLVFAIARDVTAEKEAQRAHRELTESLTTILDSIAEGVIATDPGARVTRMNPVAERLTGWPSRRALGEPLATVLDVRHAETRAPALPAGCGAARADDAVLVAHDGREAPVSVSRAPMLGADGSVDGAVLVLRDTTSERAAKEVQAQLQRQLMIAERMASVGTLAAGVAHEINNPLAYVMSNLAAIVEETHDEPGAARVREWAQMAREAHQGAERIRRIVRGLKTFARADVLRPQVIDVVRVLELSIDMTQNEIRHRARLVRDYGDAPRVEGDESHLGQVFINLLVNAAQAVPEGDTEGNEIRVVTRTDEAGRAVIEVCDTGPGIPEPILGRIFDPFFTTKPVGVGTGLGLSICHSVLTAMGGQISARNAERRGAIFRVVLPPAHPETAAAPPRGSLRPAAAPAPAKRASVLVVDDERAVGVALRRLLRGYQVTVATSADEALGALASAGPFDLILTDVMMPEKSGMDLYEAVRERDPRSADRMVFMTGGAFTHAANAFLDRVPNARLEKPFDIATLRALIDKLAG